ncbi:MAG TPA: fumarylacetoacetate hydrolase family protein [Ramlibacter sp.]|nr:fumarylacetoacetate hydrolase family protein [Ramlibacter sp.]
MSTVDVARTADPVLVAVALLQARRERRPVDALPLAAGLRDAAQAYAVQGWVAHALDGSDGAAPRYWKSGGPSREAMPTHAALPPQGVWTSPAGAGDWPCNLHLIEVEIALRLARDVTAAEAGTVTHDEAMDLVDAMAVSIELVDSRWQQGIEAPPLLKLADLQSHGALVLGPWQPFDKRDWSQQECSVHIGNRPLEQRRGTHSMGDPSWVLPAWLRHVTREGAAAPKGTVVTTGTWCGMLPASKGDLVTARFDGIGEASLQL